MGLPHSRDPAGRPAALSAPSTPGLLGPRIRSLARGLLDLLLPIACVGCERALDAGEPGVVCGRCWARLRPLPQPQCPATNSDPGYIAIGNLWDLIDPVGGMPNAFDGGNIALNAVPGAPPKAFAFYVSLPLSADNSYQGETLKVNFYMNAVKNKNNP